ncbi:MAG TPA: pentapeptide repeat-containing protein [Oscillatoriaceae cyanobacterium M7585_C2015_266]|nr:pentapeptide repeat-containing protein [Oscillatoriaceae cyanobacterium M7585_C2015_266]
MQETLSSIPQQDCLSLELTAAAIANDSPELTHLEIYLTIHFDEVWQSIAGGRVKFGIQNGQLKLKLENGKILNCTAEETEAITPIQVTLTGTETEPCWEFSAPPKQPILKGSLPNLKLGTLQVTATPCLIQAVFDIPPTAIHLTDAEGLWPHDISPNKHAILQTKLTNTLRQLTLKPRFSRVIVFQDNNLQNAPYYSNPNPSPSVVEPTELAEALQQILTAQTNDFLQLAKIAKLDPLVDFAGAYLLGATLTNCDLSGSNLARANLRGADLSDADLSEANLSGANLAGADLSGALLSNANLAGADLHRCSLALANLSGANLNSANIEAANLSNANLSEADLTNAILRNADLQHAGLVQTKLTGADLSNAKVTKARFKKDSGVSEELHRYLQEKGAIFED